MAVTYVIEFLDLFISGFITKPTLNKYFALPLSFLGLWAQLNIGMDFFVLVPAATFVSLAIGMYLNKPVVIKSPTRLSQL
jgi:glucose dehydrogenase